MYTVANRPRTPARAGGGHIPAVPITAIMATALVPLASNLDFMSSRSFVVVDPASLNLPFFHPYRDPVLTEFSDQGLDSGPVSLAGDSQKCQSHRAEPERDHAPSEALDDVVVALRRCGL